MTTGRKIFKRFAHPRTQKYASTLVRTVWTQLRNRRAWVFIQRLWLEDAQDPMKAADYCKPEPVGSERRLAPRPNS